MISEPFDGLFEGYAKRAGLPAGEVSTIAVSQALAAGIEAVADAFTKGWLNKLLQLAVGGSLLVAATGNLSERGKKELIVIGAHEVTRLIDPSPSDVKELADSLRQLIEAARRGDWIAALASGLRSPGEYAEAAAALRGIARKG
jgi:hypothetical protein